VTRPEVISGVARIPHEAIEDFVRRADEYLERKAERGDDFSVVSLLDDAVANLRQLLAEYAIVKRERDDLRAAAIGEVDGFIVGASDELDRSEEAYRQRCAVRRAFFASRSPGDKISWGIARSGVIQQIEPDYVTILDDGWPADPPLCVATSPFVLRLRIDYMLHPKLVEEAPSCT
jgi:hypothetical protein